MAPINSLQRRELSFSMSSSLKGAIAAAIVVIVLFIVGVCVFIFFYSKSSRKGPHLAHVGVKANYPSSSEGSSTESDINKSFGEKNIESSSEESSVMTRTPEPAALTRLPSRVPEEEDAAAAAAAATTTTTTTAAATQQENEAGMKPLRKPFSSPKLQQLQEDESKRNSAVSVDVPPTPRKDFV